MRSATELSAIAVNALCLILWFACATPISSRDRISADGFRGVLVGMTVEEASGAYGSPLRSAVRIPDDELSCYYVYPRDAKDDVAFMVVGERVVRIDIDQPGLLTVAGVGVGSLESEVQRAYGDRIQSSPHKYTFPKGRYLTMEQGDLAIIFETDGERVTRFRAGRHPAVAWVEGCS